MPTEPDERDERYTLLPKVVEPVVKRLLAFVNATVVEVETP